MSGINFVGEFELQEIKLTSVQGNILNFISDVNLVAVDIFENMFKTGITGSIVFADTNNFVENLPIIGQERLTFKAATPSFVNKEDIIDFTETPFIVYKIQKNEDLSANSNLVQLLFTSEETITNYRKRISKSYTDSVDNIVEDILTNELLINTKKELEIEPTVGNRRIVVPNVQPFQFIKRLARESISKKNNGSPHFLFFENKNGYNFRTLQDLYNQDVKQLYNLSDKRGDQKEEDLGQEYSRMVQFTLTANKDLIKNTFVGMLGSKLTTHDIYNKNYEVFDYGYFNNFRDFDRIDENPVYSETSVDFQNNTIGDFENSKLFLHPTSTTTDYLDAQHYTPENQTQFTSNKSHTWMQDRMNRMAEYKNGITATMKVHGMTSITVGDMIDISIPSLPSDKEDAYYSGKYLVTALRHSFAVPEKSHLIDMIVKKDSISTTLPALTPRQQGQLGGKGYRGGYGF